MTPDSSTYFPWVLPLTKSGSETLYRGKNHTVFGLLAFWEFIVEVEVGGFELTEIPFTSG